MMRRFTNYGHGETLEWYNRVKGLYPIKNQHPNVATPEKKAQAEYLYLPSLVYLWHLVEVYTGYRWRCTSYWRQSPSHQHGYALDIAPDIKLSDWSHYSVSQMSDPVLYKRERLMRKLQTLARDPTLARKYWPFVFSLAVEPDHIHLSLFRPDSDFGPSNVSVLKWKVEKPVYKDSAQRMKLPLIKS